MFTKVAKENNNTYLYFIALIVKDNMFLLFYLNNIQSIYRQS